MIFSLRRGLISAIQLLILSATLFFFFRLAPGDVFSVELENPQRSAADIEAVREARGLTQSWARRYWNWLESAAKGDLGVSLAYGIPVTTLIAPRMRNTAEVALLALGSAWLLGLGGALLANRTRFVPLVLEPGAAAATMVPDVAAVSLILWLAVWMGFSISGAWLPIAGLTFAIAPTVFLHASSELGHARRLDFVRIAQSRGISGARLWLRYTMPAAANPLISLAGLSVAAAIGSSFVVEVLTGFPGLGPLFLEAVQARDYPIVQAVLVLLAAVLILSNLAADLVLYRLDPRIRIPHDRHA
jgi:peptide/nickel transport system permease protein